MKYKRVVVLFLTIFTLCGCGNANQSKSQSDSDNTHAITECGIVKQIVDENTVLVTINKQFGNYEIGDSIYISYDKLTIESELEDAYQQTLSSDFSELNVGDEVGIQYFEKTDTQKDGLDYFNMDTIYKHVFETHGLVKKIGDDGTVTVELNDITYSKIYEKGTVVRVKYETLVDVSEESSAIDSGNDVLAVNDEVIVLYDQKASETQDGYDYFDLPVLFKVV